MREHRIAILGGGITGLAAAHRLVEQNPAVDFLLMDADHRWGGVLQTIEHGDYLIERSADMFTTRDPAALNLAKRVGLANELLDTNPKYRRAYVARQGKLHPVPEGFTLMSPTKMWPMLTSPLLSWSGKLRLLAEPFIPARRGARDESLASFARRRLGNQAFDRLVQPLVGGIYTADPEKLSLRATMPQFLEMEDRHGSLLRGMLWDRQSQRDGQAGSGARYGQFVAPRRGMQQLVDAVVARLPPEKLRLNCRVENIERTEHGWRLTDQQGRVELFTDLIFALPNTAHELLRQVDAQLGQLVGSIPSASCSVVVLAYPKGNIGKPINGFGFVVPAQEGRPIIAGSLASLKFPGRAPEDRILFRIFFGGALQPGQARLPDEELVRLARQELAELMQVTGEPEVKLVVRWLDAMPQYHLGHLDLVADIKERAKSIPHFRLAGKLYEGVGIPFCVQSGEAAAEAIVSDFAREKC